jgi:purine-binding chemotaxis protein CheW
MSLAGRPDTRKPRHSAKALQVESPGYYVAFGLNQEVFAVGIGFVREILQFNDLTEVPLLPPFVRGVINLRGAAVPVLDLSIRFGWPPTQVLQRSCVMILEVAQEGQAIVIGVMVDNVHEVMELAPSEIDPAPSVGSDPKSGFICGIAKVQNKFVILLDAARLLSASEVSQFAPESATGIALT